jgi:hypothetical protein
MRIRRALLVVTTLFACADPTVPDPTPGIAPPAAVKSVTAAPPIDDAGDVARSVRFTMTLGHAFPADVARDGHVVIVGGGASDADASAIAHHRELAALRDREVPLVAWTDPPNAPTSIFVQPARALDKGRATLILTLDRQTPFTFDVTVRDEPAPASRVWPVGDATAGPNEKWTWCASALPDDLPPSIDLAPQAITATLRRRSDAPCFDAIATTTPKPGTIVAPTTAGSLALDPAPITIAAAPTDAPPDATCRDGELAAGPLCLRIDDDRVVIVGTSTPTLVLGSIGDDPIVAPLVAQDRFVVRGFVPTTTIDLSLAVRTSIAESGFTLSATLASPHRHVVINEVLFHPPSGAATQRFVELVNDGDRPASLGGLRIQAGSTPVDLPAQMVPPGAFVLIVPAGWIDGLGGDVPSPPGVMRVEIDALPASGAVTLFDGAGAILSTFPATTSTRTASRGRRHIDDPDDAPDAFGFDAHDKATPGAPNAIE